MVHGGAVLHDCGVADQKYSNAGKKSEKKREREKKRAREKEK